MIKYIGSKRALVPWITEVVEKIALHGQVKTVADPFSGSARVAYALKQKGFYVIASDINRYAFTLAQALIEADAREYPRSRVEPILKALSDLPPDPGWFTKPIARKQDSSCPKTVPASSPYATLLKRISRMSRY